MCPFLTHLSPSLQQLFDIPEQKMEIPILLKYFYHNRQYIVNKYQKKRASFFPVPRRLGRTGFGAVLYRAIYPIPACFEETAG